MKPRYTETGKRSTFTHVDGKRVDSGADKSICGKSMHSAVADGERVPDGWSRASGGAQRCTGGRSTPYTGTSDAGGTNAGHTASEPDASFTCPDCARTFKSYYAVCAHAKVHAHLHGQLRTILAPGRNVTGPGSELAVEGAITSADAVVVQYGSAPL